MDGTAEMDHHPAEADAEHRARQAEDHSLIEEDPDDLAGGRVWTGEQALARGLVDQLGDFATAVELACTAAGLPTDGRVNVVPVNAPGRWLMAEAASKLEERMGLRSVRQLAGAVDLLAGGELARLLARERVWMIAELLPRIRF